MNHDGTRGIGTHFGINEKWHIQQRRRLRWRLFFSNFFFVLCGTDFVTLSLENHFTINMIENSVTFCNIQWNHFTCHHNKSNDIEHLFYISHLGSWNPPSENDKKNNFYRQSCWDGHYGAKYVFWNKHEQLREHSKSDFVLFYGYCN